MDSLVCKCIPRALWSSTCHCLSNTTLDHSERREQRGVSNLTCPRRFYICYGQSGFQYSCSTANETFWTQEAFLTRIWWMRYLPLDNRHSLYKRMVRDYVRNGLHHAINFLVNPCKRHMGLYSRDNS